MCTLAALCKAYRNAKPVKCKCIPVCVCVWPAHTLLWLRFYTSAVINLQELKVSCQSQWVWDGGCSLSLWAHCHQRYAWRWILECVMFYAPSTKVCQRAQNLLLPVALYQWFTSISLSPQRQNDTNECECSKSSCQLAKSLPHSYRTLLILILVSLF